MTAPIRLWRIGTDAPTYQARDLSGKGAELSGGRWNRKGTPLVYASGTRALACLETVVHLGTGEPLPLNRYLVEITVPPAAWAARTMFDPAANVGWDAEPAGQISLDWGTAWARAASTLLAEVPSVIVPEECNYLLNPAHADLATLAAAKVRKWTYDMRLSRSRVTRRRR
ncbi:MAG: RES family NAD+ phosphorylase [Gemmatimonadaceae bacterium]